MAVGDIITSDGKTLTIEDLRKIAVEVEKLISSNSKDPGEWEEVKSLSGITSLPVLQSLGASYKLVRVAVEILKGVDGHDVEFQVDADRTAIQWRKVSVSGGEPSEWKTLIQLSYLKGDAGETPEFRKGDTGLEWKYKSEEDTSWRSLIAIDDLRWHFTDLTKDQIAELWHELPDDVLTEFQAPALEAAEVANAGADRANAAAEATEQTNVEVCEQEAERIKAEAARIEAEIERVAAEQERSTSEIARKNSETKRTEAEALRGSNESERQTAETERKESETVRKEAETIRKTSESERNTSENLRKEAETARIESESSRVQVEASRVRAEQTRTETEVERTKAESKRKESESVRVEAESLRTLSEEQRIKAEAVREAAEIVRGVSEEEREAAEVVRQNQEEIRQSQETKRETSTEISIQKANEAADRANTAAEAAEGIVSGIRPDWLSGKESPNYIKNKPEIPTLEAIPDENTLSYVNTDGTTINFRIGDDVRVAEDGEYVFYRLYDLAGGKASWQESGSGTALPGNVYLTGANYYNESVRTIKQGYLSNE